MGWSRFAKRTSLLKGLLASATIVAVPFVGVRDARAQVFAGGDFGFAIRSSDPGLDPGMAVGAHVEYKIVPMVSVGGYFLHYDLGVQGAPPLDPAVIFNAYGGRVRLILPLEETRFYPYALIGLGYTSVTYPSNAIVSPMIGVGGTRPTQFTSLAGHFAEVPFGLGLGYKVAKIAMISAEFVLRPGFGFGGDAYSLPNGFGEPKMGFTGMLGASLDF